MSSGVGVGLETPHLPRETLPDIDPVAGQRCGRYKSYWNAYLFKVNNVEVKN